MSSLGLVVPRSPEDTFGLLSLVMHGLGVSLHHHDSTMRLHHYHITRRKMHRNQTGRANMLAKMDYILQSDVFLLSLSRGSCSFQLQVKYRSGGHGKMKTTSSL